VVLVLAVSDEMDDALLADLHAVRQAQLIVACGDLPFEYLGQLMNALNVPLVFVPGNHDPDISGYRTSRAGLPLRAGLPARLPWPDGAISAEQRVVDAAGLRLAGLGGCRRYSAGPNQYTEWQQARRAHALAGRAWWRRARDGRGVDVLLTHAPPEGVGDGPDPPHRGHGLEVTIWPSRDCRTRRSSPVPWQVVQVTAVVPGLAPDPEQVSQVIAARTVTSFSAPSTASWNSRSSRASTFSPGGGPACLACPRPANGPAAPPKKASKMSPSPPPAANPENGSPARSPPGPNMSYCRRRSGSFRAS